MHLTSKDGISQSEIYSFLEDSQGFLWFGTVDGLNRYDGNNITIYNTDRDNVHSLPNNTIRSLIEDNDNRIWIGTDDGLAMYDLKKERIYQIKVKGYDNVILQVNSLFLEGNTLFLGTSIGLFQTDIGTDNLETIESNFNLIEIQNKRDPELNYIQSITKSHDGGIWLQYPHCILKIFSNNGNIIIIKEKHFTENIINIKEDIYKNLWIITRNNGLMRYSPEEDKLLIIRNVGTTNSYLSSNKLSSIIFDKNQNLWIGTRDKGLNFLSSNQLENDILKFEHIKNISLNKTSLNSDLIYSLYISKSNQLWVGTIGSGINMFDPNHKKFNYRSLNNSNFSTNYTTNFIRAILVDENEQTFIGTHNNGLFIMDRENGNIEKVGLETQSIFFISNFKKNQFFICATNGIYLIELRNKSIKILDNFKWEGVFNVVTSENDIYWFATLNGLLRGRVVDSKIIIDEKYDITTSPSISINNCRVLFYNKKNNELLLGTEGGGLNVVKLDSDKFAKEVLVFKKQQDERSLSSNYVRSIYQDSNNDFWVGTFEGLNKIEHIETSSEITFQTFDKDDGLPNNMIQSITEDFNGNLWIGTNRGLSKMNLKTKEFTNYNSSDGIQNNEFSEHTIFRTNKGEIILGGIDGLTSFYPNKIKKSELIPKPTITDFYLSNKRISVEEKVGGKVILNKGIALADSIQLAPSQNNIGFDFSAMLFDNPKKIKYAFKLDGFDEKWNYTDATNRNASYTNLKHGKYTFKLKSTNSDGIWLDTPKEVFILINTPFYYSWIAYVLYAILVFLVLYGFSKFSIVRYTFKNRILLENEHNQKLQDLNNLRTEFFINISHDLRTPLSLIKGPLDRISQDNSLNSDLKSKLELIKRNVKRLNYLIDQLLDIRKAETGKLNAELKYLDIVEFAKEEASHFNYAIENQNLKLSISHSENSFYCSFDPDKISKVFFNLLSNAVKFTDFGEISIHIDKINKKQIKSLKPTHYNNFIRIKIADTGTGIPKEILTKIFGRFYQNESKIGKGYGIGLSHCVELLEAHSGFIEVHSEEGIGTIFSFYIPFLESPSNLELNETKMESSTENIFMGKNTESAVKPFQPKMHLSKTVLIVEDNADMRLFLKSELESFYNIIEACDGFEGLLKMDEYTIDIIISDIMMPNMDGIEFCKKIKTNLKTSHIPIILLTAKIDDSSKYEGIETGADDYISKPFDITYLLLRVENILKNRDLLRKLFQSNTGFEPSKVTVTSLDEEFLTKLLETLEKGIPEADFNINSLESGMGMSHSNFYRKITSLTGQSAKEILISMRMKRAHQLLSDNKNIRVSEVSYMVGFTNPKYFGKCFKEKFGYSPTQTQN